MPKTSPSQPAFHSDRRHLEELMLSWLRFPNHLLFYQLESILGEEVILAAETLHKGPGPLPESSSSCSTLPLES